jgi:predicted nuclease of predicted toxin-antitoxin system
MRILLDECLPRRWAELIVGHVVTTVPRAGLAGLKNGTLLLRIEGNHDVFVTVDQNLAAQQNLRERGFGVIVVRAPSNTLASLAPLTPLLLAALERTGPGRVEIIGPAD